MYVCVYALMDEYLLNISISMEALEMLQPYFFGHMLETIAAAGGPGSWPC